MYQDDLTHTDIFGSLFAAAPDSDIFPSKVLAKTHFHLWQICKYHLHFGKLYSIREV